ncbi:jg17916 [Pararge aegeria aegeria]|uniref:Jg17916 protein n=1 Tax=Pararge aegeria aegeria TaxID=348720 RepID=A0A8S4RKY1_9NEOP|nr:jg17916 [Pararge aegeria aegeria]
MVIPPLLGYQSLVSRAGEVDDWGARLVLRGAIGYIDAQNRGVWNTLQKTYAQQWTSIGRFDEDDDNTPRTIAADRGPAATTAF